MSLDRFIAFLLEETKGVLPVWLAPVQVEVIPVNLDAHSAYCDELAKALRKGSLVGVDGRIRQRSWERRDGTKATTLEVIANQVEFLEPKGKRDIPNEDFGYEAVDSANAEEAATEQANDESKNLDSFDVVDDDIPF